MAKQCITNAYAKRGTLVRIAYLLVAVVCWCLRGLWGLSRQGVVVLCYHGVTAKDRGRFAWQMKQIAGRTVAPVSFPTAGDRRQTRSRVCITFDDAFECLADNALPLLQELGIGAFVFAVPGNLGAKPRWCMPAGHPEREERTMTADQLVAVDRGGLCRIGSHTATHADLRSIPLEQARRELVESKAALERVLRRPVEDLALPHGSYDQNVMMAAREAGYTRIFTLDPWICAGNDAGGRIGRFSMSPDVWRIEFLLTCAGAYAWLSPWRRFLRRVRAALRPAGRQEPVPT